MNTIEQLDPDPHQITETHLLNRASPLVDAESVVDLILLLPLLDLEVARMDIHTGVLHIPGGGGREPADQGQEAASVHFGLLQK